MPEIPRSAWSATGEQLQMGVDPNVLNDIGYPAHELIGDTEETLNMHRHQPPNTDGTYGGDHIPPANETPTDEHKRSAEAGLREARRAIDEILGDDN